DCPPNHRPASSVADRPRGNLLGMAVFVSLIASRFCCRPTVGRPDTMRAIQRLVASSGETESKSYVVGWSGLILVPALAKGAPRHGWKREAAQKQDQADDEPRRGRQLPEDAEREEPVENDAEGDDGEQEDRREDDDV